MRDFIHTPKDEIERRIASRLEWNDLDRRYTHNG